MKNTRGITLIALVITIIVLLILAGISIAMLTGENGTLKKANTATRENEIAEAKEQAKLDIAEWTTNQLEKGKEANISNSIIQEILEEKEYVGNVGADKFTTKKNGYEILYSDLMNNIIGASETENTVIPGVTVTGGNKTYTKNGIATIPVGFSIVPGLDDISQGLVITDEVGNEFVWVPVTSESEYVRNTTYYNTNVSESAIDDTNYLPTGVEVPEGKTEGQVEKEMVVKAGGFYIARYEAGKENGTKPNTFVAVSKKGATVYLTEKTDAINHAKAMFNDEYVKSALITGIQWDVTMAFVNKKLDGKGEIFNVETNSPTRHIGKKASGQNEADKVCNIYDLEGNYWEFVAEKNTFQKYSTNVARGGFDFLSGAVTKAASDRWYADHLGRAFRCVLYVLV